MWKEFNMPKAKELGVLMENHPHLLTLTDFQGSTETLRRWLLSFDWGLLTNFRQEIWKFSDHWNLDQATALAFLATAMCFLTKNGFLCHVHGTQRTACGRRTTWLCTQNLWQRFGTDIFKLNARSCLSKINSFLLASTQVWKGYMLLNLFYYIRC